MLGGVGAGLAGATLTWLLIQVQAVAYGVRADTLLIDVQLATPLRRVLAPAGAGLIAGLGWWWLRSTGGTVDVRQSLDRPGRMGLVRPLADAVLQIVVVGAGASLGREGAPRLVAGAIVDTLGARLRLSAVEARAMIAAGAGAGLAAVYNVPLSGAIFALEIVLIWCPWRAVVAALPMSVIATVVAWPVVSNRPTYVFPDLPFEPSMVAVAFFVIPATTLLALGFNRLARWATTHRPLPGWRLPLSIGLAGALVGVVSIWRSDGVVAVLVAPCLNRDQLGVGDVEVAAATEPGEDRRGEEVARRHDRDGVPGAEGGDQGTRGGGSSGLLQHRPHRALHPVGREQVFLGQNARQESGVGGEEERRPGAEQESRSRELPQPQHPGEGECGHRQQRHQLHRDEDPAAGQRIGRGKGHRWRNQHTLAGLQAAAPAVLDVLGDAAGPGDVELTVEVSLKDTCHLMKRAATAEGDGALPVSVASPPARELDQGPHSDLRWVEEVWVRAT